MMRHGDLKYTFRTHDSAELYDLASDPQEIRNLAREKTFEARAEEMKSALFSWYRPPEIAE